MFNRQLGESGKENQPININGAYCADVTRGTDMTRGTPGILQESEKVFDQGALLPLLWGKERSKSNTLF